jgi:hypothetical protein
MFTVTNGQPHLRVFANHEPAELKQQSDFIAPQPVYFHPAESATMLYQRGGETESA